MFSSTYAEEPLMFESNACRFSLVLLWPVSEWLIKLKSHYTTMFFSLGFLHWVSARLVKHTEAPITLNSPSDSSHKITADYVRRSNRCWPIIFHNVTARDADRWCQKWPVGLAPQLVWSSSNYFAWRGDTFKIETPNHDSIRELMTWECKEHGVKSWMC